MADTFRGGNSRQLSKTLDGLETPIAVLERRGQIVFVNSALCRMAQADATQLVGKQCSWDIADDNLPFGAILNALAPPASARSGKTAIRSLTTPVVFGSPWSGQLFLPLLDGDRVVDTTIVVFGHWEQLKTQIPEPVAWTRSQKAEVEETILGMRSRWNQTDGLHALLGESHEIQLAMTRAQLAIDSRCNVLLVGPPSVGKAQVARGIFGNRLKKNGLKEVSGQYFPIDCSLLNGELIAGMLEVFSGRLRPGIPGFGQQLVLEKLDQLSGKAISALADWLEAHREACVVVGLSRKSESELSQRSADWRRLIAGIAEMEVTLPALVDRRQDIPALAQQALAVACRSAERALLSLSPEAVDLLTAFAWPNNLVQLTSAIQDAVAHAVLTSTIHVQHLPVEIRTYPGSIRSAEGETVQAIRLDQLLEDVERIVLRRALKLSPRNRAQVARWLSISRPRLLRRISQLGLDEQASPDSSQEPGPESEDLR